MLGIRTVIARTSTFAVGLGIFLGWLIGMSSALAADNPQPAQQVRPSADQQVTMELTWGPREALRQREMMAKALKAIKPGVDGRRDVFILSAALGSEHVFDQEAANAAAILAKRYAASERTVVLSNGAIALGIDRPAANPDHFAAALGKVAEVMNRDEDVFILFFTSHGIQNRGAAIYDANRMRAILSPQRLKAMLAEVGIKNKVVIVSACFAGAYLPYLADDTSAVFVAARADRTSFGCQPERDWTYFGDALFGHALKGGATLIDGFEEAKKLIDKWEAEQKVTPSLPSAAIGEGARRYLADIEGRTSGERR